MKKAVRRLSKIENNGFDTPGEGNIGGGDGDMASTHDMVVALCDRMVVAILGESQRHKDHSAVVDCPGGPRVGQERGLFMGGGPRN